MEQETFENDGELIHEEVQKIGSLEKLNDKEFPISVDTVMHLTAAEVLVKVVEGERAFFPVLYRVLVEGAFFPVLYRVEK